MVGVEIKTERWSDKVYATTLRKPSLPTSKLRPVYDITIDYIKRVKVVNPPHNSNVKIMDYTCGYPDNRR